AVAQFRAATAPLVGDRAWEAFVASLGAASEAFRTCWARHDLADAVTWEKAVCHPTAGRLRLRYASLAPDAQPADVRVIVYLT
ncbi:MAG: hypothetical protein JO180_05065, partial [Gemmatirosa sp.]|nr:hypothetical protein [Gemmatirosa sp.]